jgi:hypothetical protein
MYTFRSHWQVGLQLLAGRSEVPHRPETQHLSSTKQENTFSEHYIRTFPCKPKIFWNRVRKSTINAVKLKEYKCGERWAG